MVWLAWLDDQWEVPDRHDMYQMQTACEVRRVLSRKPNSIKISDFRLSFGNKSTSPKQNLTKEQVSEISKSHWLGVVGEFPFKFEPAPDKAVKSSQGLIDPPENYY